MNIRHLESAIFLSRLGMCLGGLVAATSVLYAGRAQPEFDSPALAVTLFYAMVDLSLRDFSHEKTRFLLRWLRRSGLALAASSVWGVMVGVELGSPGTTLLFAGILIYGLSGFGSALSFSWLLFPERRPQPRSADAHREPV